MAETKGVEAVERALAILEVFRHSDGELSLAEIARRSGFYKSTILRLAVSLQKYGYLVRTDSGGFRLGPTAWRLGSIYRGNFNLADILRPSLKELCERTNETASFYIREGAERLCLYRSEPVRAIRHTLVEGVRMPITKGATGKVLASFSEDPAEGDEEIRKSGYALSLGERDPEVAAVSVPLFSQNGVLLGALSVSGLVHRFDKQHCKEFLSALFSVQEQLSKKLL